MHKKAIACFVFETGYFVLNGLLLLVFLT